MSNKLQIKSNITFLYYKNLEEAASFYGEIMGLEQKLDVGWAKLYAIHGGAFLGLVDDSVGFYKAQEENAVLITFVVEDVQPWHNHLKQHTVQALSEIKVMENIQVKSFFFRDPGGYSIEIQQFLIEDIARTFFQID